MTLKDVLFSTYKLLIYLGSLIAVLFISYVIFSELSNPNLPSTSFGVFDVNRIGAKLKDGELKDLKLPTIVNTDSSVTVHLDTSKFKDRTDISMATMLVYENFYCYVDDELVYSYEVGSKNTLKSGGFSAHIIDFPFSLKGRDLKLVYEPTLGKDVGVRISDISMGERYDIIVHKFLKEDILTMMVSLLMVIFFIASLVIATIYYKNKHWDSGVMYMGLFSLLVALYAAPQAFIVRYQLSSYHLSLYSLEYIVIMLASVPLLAMLRGKLNPKYDIVFCILMLINSINAIVQILLVLLSDIEFKNLQYISNALLIASAIVVVASLLATDSSKYYQKRQLVYSFMPVAFSVVFGLAISILEGMPVHVEFILLGVSVFLFVQTIQTIKIFLRLKDEKTKRNLYETMAYMDILTSLENRTAYTSYIEDEKNALTPKWVVVIDVNNLKFINDNLGHDYGDFALQYAGRMIKAMHENFDMRSFRTGGDEFVVFINEDRQFDVQRFLLDLSTVNIEKLDEEEKQIKPKLAFGYSFFDPAGGKNLERVVYFADKSMYEDKRIKKKESGYEW